MISKHTCVCVYVCNICICIYQRLERLEFGTAVGKAKVFGTIMGIGGAMLFTFYKGFPIQPLKSDINLLPGTSTGHVALLASDHRVLAACLALASCFSYAIWIILQVSNICIYVRVLCFSLSSGFMVIKIYIYIHASSFKNNIYTHPVMKDMMKDTYIYIYIYE